MEDNKQIAKKEDYGALVINQVGTLVNTGLTMPKDYNYVNAVKASMLVLNEMTDKQGNKILPQCTKGSVMTSLFKMVTKGLDVSKGHGAFIKRGNKLCFQEEYFGRAIQIKRIYPNFELTPRVVHEGDKFAFDTDPSTGRRVLVEHTQTLESIDKPFIGAYVYIPCSDGGRDLYIMTRQQILTAWSKSTDRDLRVHKTFPEKMVMKTIINSASSFIVNSTPELATFAPQTGSENGGDVVPDAEDYDEGVEFEEVPTEAAPVEAPAEVQEVQDADF